MRLLGVQDGFLANPKVHIPLPGALQDASRLLKTLGQGRQVQELEVALNRAAESAVPLAKTLLVNAVRSMSVADAKGILTGGDTAATEFFARKTREPLAVQFLPVVRQATARVGLACQVRPGGRQGRRASGWSSRRTPASTTTSPARRWTGCTW